MLKTGSPLTAWSQNPFNPLNRKVRSVLTGLLARSQKPFNTKRAEDPFTPARRSGSDTSTSIEVSPSDNDIALKDVSSRVEPVAVDNTTSFDEELLASLDFGRESGPRRINHPAIKTREPDRSGEESRKRKQASK